MEENKLSHNPVLSEVKLGALWENVQYYSFHSQASIYTFLATRSKCIQFKEFAYDRFDHLSYLAEASSYCTVLCSTDILSWEERIKR